MYRTVLYNKESVKQQKRETQNLTQSNDLAYKLTESIKHRSGTNLIIVYIFKLIRLQSLDLVIIFAVWLSCNALDYVELG